MQICNKYPEHLNEQQFVKIILSGTIEINLLSLLAIVDKKKLGENYILS